MYGIKNSNRNFTREESWGKNQFNNVFPVPLACYMYSKNIRPIYIKVNENLKISKEYIGVDEVFGINLLDNDIAYFFEEKLKNMIGLIKEIYQE